MSGIKKGDIVECWPGVRGAGRSYTAAVISDGIVEFGGTPCYRVRERGGGTDYIAEAHVALVARVEGRTAYVPTSRAALEVCDFDLDDVVIEDNAERIKMQKLLKGFR